MELKNGNGLNSWFNAILWLNIAFSGIGLLMSIISMMKAGNGFDLYALVSICAVCVAIAGFYWLLKADKVGFYLFIAGCLLNAAIAYVQYCKKNTEQCILLQEAWLSRVCGQASATLFYSCCSCC